MSAPLCTVCLDTGSKSQEMGGDLDCTACTAADDRSGLRWLLALRPSEDDSDVWRAYQLGKAAAAPVVPVAAQPVVPEGWQLVPIEPTEAMLGEVDEDVGGHCYSCSVWKASWDDCRRVYAAMLAAAPQPAASVTDVAKDAARLDWLADQHGAGYQIGGTKGMGWFYICPHSGSASKLFDSSREAIDAAIAAQQGEKT